MTIEPATIQDVADVAQLLAAQFREHGIGLDPNALNHAIRGAIEDPARGAFLLARDDGPVGVAYLAFTWTLEHGGRSAWLEELYVIPARRSRGLGSHLLRKAMTHARATGAVAIDLEVDEGHARAAHLYVREGFHPHRRTRWFARL